MIQLFLRHLIGTRSRQDRAAAATRVVTRAVFAAALTASLQGATCIAVDLFSKSGDQPLIQPHAAKRFREATYLDQLLDEKQLVQGAVVQGGSQSDESSQSSSGVIQADDDEGRGNVVPVAMKSVTADASDSIGDAMHKQAEDHCDRSSGTSGSAADEVCAERPEWCADELAEAPVSRFRNSFLQGVQFSSGVVGTGGGSSLGQSFIQLSASGAIPLGNSETITDNILTVSPGFRADLMDVPAGVDIPNTLYEPSLTCFWRRVINDKLTSSLIMTPSLRSDFTTSENAFRIFGLALLTWERIPDKLWLSAGAVYLDRADMSALPAAGLTWKPTPVWKLEVQFPQPRICYRTAKDGANSESWVYLGGGFGGNTWAVTRAGGQSDQLTVNDLRMIVGYERLVSGNRGGFAEAGWAFNRSMEYTDLPFEQDFSDAFVARVGLTF